MKANCAFCGSTNQRMFAAEANIHFPGLRGIDTGSIFIFPRFLICLDCGQLESTLSNNELEQIREKLVAVPRPAESSSAA
jgi:hypothetical protein